MGSGNDVNFDVKRSPLEVADQQAAAVAKTENRVSLQQIEENITAVEYFHPSAAAQVTIAAVTTRNGFTTVGTSAPADPANFDAELGRKFAREDAIRQLWPLMGYALAEKLAA